MDLEINNKKEELDARVSVIPEDHEDQQPAVNYSIPGPIPDFVDLHVQKQESSSKPGSKSRVSKRSTRSSEKVTKRSIRAREKISKEKLKKAVARDTPKFCPKGSRTTCGKRIGDKTPTIEIITFFN